MKIIHYFISFLEGPLCLWSEKQINLGPEGQVALRWPSLHHALFKKKKSVPFVVGRRQKFRPHYFCLQLSNFLMNCFPSFQTTMLQARRTLANSGFCSGQMFSNPFHHVVFNKFPISKRFAELPQPCCFHWGIFICLTGLSENTAVPLKDFLVFALFFLSQSGFPS